MGLFGWVFSVLFVGCCLAGCFLLVDFVVGLLIVDYTWLVVGVFGLITFGLFCLFGYFY